MDYVQAAIGAPSRAEHPIRTLTTKIGGSPVGLAPQDWPECSQCGRDMDFLLQLDLRSPINLSGKFKFAYIFFCNGYSDEPNSRQCPSWDPLAGSNRVLLLSSPDASCCVDGRGVVRYDDFSLPMRTRLEPVVDSQNFSLPSAAFLDRSGKEDIRDNTSCTVKIGGTPIFLQAPEEVDCPECGGPLTFLAQIGSELEDPGWGGYSFNASGGEFLVFKCRKECSPSGAVVYLQIT